MDFELYGEYGISFSDDPVEGRPSEPQEQNLFWLTGFQSKLSLSDDASPLDESSKSKLKLGLFSYPVLQAADILVHRYGPNLIPYMN